MFRFRNIALVLALVLGQSAALSAQQITTDAVFDVSFRGIKAGVAAFKGVTTDNAYTVAGQLKSTGLIGAVVNLSYNVKAQGVRQGDRFIPRSYSENNRDGAAVSRATISFQNGVPNIVDTNPPATRGPYALDPATQAGTLDPGTGLFTVLRDRPRNEVCNESVDIFDGSRRARVTLGAPKEANGQITCAGSYTRIAGYEPWEMEERKTFLFRAEFRPAGDLWQVSRVGIQTVYGEARLDRR